MHRRSAEALALKGERRPSPGRGRNGDLTLAEAFPARKPARKLRQTASVLCVIGWESSLAFSDEISPHRIRSLSSTRRARKAPRCFRYV